MASNDSNRIDPLQNIFNDIKKILDYIVLKDEAEANKFETPEIKRLAAMWMNAKYQKDQYSTYSEYWDFGMFQSIVTNLSYDQYNQYKSNPFTVPMIYRDHLLQIGRKKFMSQYEEQNEYYRMLNGLPPIDTKKEDFIYLSEPIRNQLHASNDPVHLLSPLIQNNYMSTDEYKEVLKNNPDKKYLKYLGMYKIDIFVARNAKDFEIIRYLLNRSDINPNLIDTFSKLYASYREYVMTTLYNKQLEDVFEGYRNFMGSLIMMFTLMQIPNKALESITSKQFLDDAILHIMLSTYGIDNKLLLTNEIRRNLCINMLKLIRERGTDDIYYDLIEILGYQDIIISKLLLMKGQQFDKDDNYKVKDKVKPYFLQIDLQDKNIYDTISNGKAPIYSYESIVSNDPTWWDTPDVQKILEESNYSISDSKYITIEAVIHQMEYMFESIYFSRMILDNKSSTDTFYIEIPELFGTKMISIYDIMVTIISAMCMINDLPGEIITNETKLLSTAGFNFELNFDSFNEFLDTTKYVDRDRIIKYLNNLTITDKTDINRLFNEVLYPMREWLESKIVNATNRHEYVEYESIYRALYTYDINHNTFLDDYELPLITICKKYNITSDEIKAYKHFYPRTITGEVVTVESFGISRYHSPFVSEGNEIPYFIHITLDTPYGEDDRGYLYFHDILNCEDIRELESFQDQPDDHMRIFMDYSDDEIGWEVNEDAVNKAIELIDKLPDEGLFNAFFQVNTPILNSNGLSYTKGERLPSNIRSSIYKQILKEKILMDVSGFAKAPTTYQEYLYRKNRTLYDLLYKDDRFNLNKSAWMEDIMKLILSIETELDLHMKYFEQSILGQESFFRPLISLIEHFKSSFVDIAKTGLRFIFDDKIDSGGNSNMFKLFDDVNFVINFITLANRGYESQFGLYDTEHRMKHSIIIKDRSEMLTMTTEGFDAHVREERMGSLHMVDEVKFFKNQHDIDPNEYSSVWFNGEPNTGRWSEEDNILMMARKKETKINNNEVDLDGWKDFRNRD